MKKTSLIALLYREVLLLKKSVIVGVITSASIIGISLLVILSFRHGNLAMLNDETKDMFLKDATLMIKLYSVFAACLISSIPSDTAMSDVKSSWERFRRSTPVSCTEFAMAKAIVFAVAIAVSFLSGIGTMALICACMGISMTSFDVGMVLLILVVTSAFGVLMQTTVTLTRSQDKGGLLAVAILFPIVTLAVSPWIEQTSHLTSEERMVVGEDMLMGFLEKALPFLPFVLVGIVLIDLVDMTLIYKRREK